MEVPLQHHRLAASLAGQPIGGQIVYHRETGSTNDEARDLAALGHPEGTAVFADHQTGGRGRRGATWFSAPCRDLLFSVIFRPAWAPDDWTRLTHIAALAVCEGVESLHPRLRLQIKWPNDIHVGGKKLAGILLESTFAHGRPPTAVLGIGLNVNLQQKDVPQDLRPFVTSLRMELGNAPQPREPVAAAILRALGRLYRTADTDFATVIAGNRSRSLLLSKSVRIHTSQGELVGVAVDYSPRGELIVETVDGVRRPIASALLVRLEGEAAG